MNDPKNQPGDRDYTQVYEVMDRESKADIKPAPAQSQAVRDIQEAGLTPEEAVATAKRLAESGKKSQRPEKLAKVAGFRWLVLLILSLAGVAMWAVDSQFFSQRVYAPIAWGVLGLSLLLGLLSFKVLRLPTRAGLTALAWGATFFIDALYGPSPYFLSGAVGAAGFPAVLLWAGLLTLIFIWVLVAIWRKLGRYKAIDVILGIILLYAAVGSLWGVFANFGATLNFASLSTSPVFLTDKLPWVLWPATVMVFFILPLAALLSLGDQLSAFKRKGRRHGGNFFVAVAFVLLMPYGYLTYDKAVAETPALSAAVNTLKEAVGISPAEEIILVYKESPATPATTVEEAAPTEEMPTPAEAVIVPPVVTAPEAEPAFAEAPIVTVTPAESPAVVLADAPTTAPAPVVTPAPATPAAVAAPAPATPAAVAAPAPATPAAVASPAPATAAPAQAMPAQVAPVQVAPVQVAPVQAVVTQVEATGVDPAELRALKTRLEDTEENLQRAIMRLEKAEAALAEAAGRITELEKRLQEPAVSPDDHSGEAPPEGLEVLDQRT